MATSTSPTADTIAPWRRSFNFSQWATLQLAAWDSIGKEAGVRVEWIAGGSIPELWSDSEQLRLLVTGMLQATAESAFPGALIRLAASVDGTKHEWLTFEVRDQNGGRDDSWALRQELRAAARRLEGFVDIVTEANRTTTCALHIPTGTLQGWLRRNSDRRSIYAVDSGEGRWLGERDRAIQAELYKLGSIHRLNDATYLVASKDDAPVSKLLRDLTGGFVRSLGSMNEFVLRLDRATRWDAAHHEATPKLRQDESVSAGVEAEVSNRRVFKEPKLMQALRPRRVNVGSARNR